jgi:hypothetical protein
VVSAVDNFADGKIADLANAARGIPMATAPSSSGSCG